MGKTKEIINTPLKAMILFALSGIIAGLLAMLTYFTALKLGATSRIVPISATYPLVTVILGILILGEQVTLIRIIGTILIIAGIWLVNPVRN
jgi:transporter family protein